MTTQVPSASLLVQHGNLIGDLPSLQRGDTIGT